MGTTVRSDDSNAAMQATLYCGPETAETRFTGDRMRVDLIFADLRMVTLSQREARVLHGMLGRLLGLLPKEKSK